MREIDKIFNRHQLLSDLVIKDFEILQNIENADLDEEIWQIIVQYCQV